MENSKKPKEILHSNRIRSILIEKNMTQKDLADKALDGNKGHLSRIINGSSKCLSLPIAFKIARALDKNVEEVFIYRGDL
jgi:DNA-binding XRE family transcriptional regulator